MYWPVVTDARVALREGDVTPVLKWVLAEDEQAIRELFAHTRGVRELGPEARALADRYFFESLVRIHRASEGEPYTGLKPADAPIEPGIELADAALVEGSADHLVEKLTSHVEASVREGFQDVSEKAGSMNDSVEAGRAYVKAYVEYIHFVKGIHEALQVAAHAHATN